MGQKWLERACDKNRALGAASLRLMTAQSYEALGAHWLVRDSMPLLICRMIARYCLTSLSNFLFL